jgi:NAD(P)-dependent dehydrogenase (short-subunit alcohol dehydrogenase family)
VRVDLKNEVAIVTGGAQGIGRAIVEQLSENGATVAIIDIEAEVAERTARELSAGGARIASFIADVSNESQVRDKVRTIAERFGTISILINNAGINTREDRRPIHEYGRTEWDRILGVDLTGVFVMSQAALPFMLSRGRGRIVNIASIAGLVPLRLQSAYVAAKAGVVNLTKSMACELGANGILVNAVAPGSTLSRGTEALFYGPGGAYSEKAASLIAHIPLGRPGRPEEIAAAVLFLCAPEASYVNGTVLTVDGGWTAGYVRDW